ncbi:ABC-type transport auxiliary lipoprotein family protein [Variovorax sp. RHLX14]|uniref:ABC-type transport auxiliary lipoprotein family protein n=1 Tax=Variovorax sp. RHLX14 TaxID=1259731 RepID=UPI003F45AD44
MTHRIRSSVALTCVLALLAGCGALPEKPARSTLYDFGPGLVAPATAVAPGAANSLPTLALAEVESSARLEGTQVLYRLGYADANELRPYGQARWSVAPTQLVQQRLRSALSANRTVLGTEESATLARAQGNRPNTLRISLDEFTHYFATPTSSTGLVRLRATLVQGTAGGDRVIAQRIFMAQRPAPSADAAGGVKALAAASDAAIAEIVAWVDAAPR